MVDARLDRDDAVGERERPRSPVAGAGCSCTSIPRPWPSPWPNSSPSPSAAISSRATASTSRPLAPARVASSAGQLGREADLVRAGELVGQRAGRERPRAVGVVAVERRGGVDDDAHVRLDHTVAGARVRRARRSPRRRRSAGTPSRPRPSSRIVDSIHQASSLLRPPDERLLGEAGEALVRDRRRARGSRPARRAPSPRGTPSSSSGAARARSRRRRAPPRRVRERSPPRTRPAAAGAAGSSP